MNVDLKTIVAKLTPALAFCKKYGSFMFLVAVLAIYSFLVFDISRLTNAEPSDDAVQEKLKTVQVPKIDESTLKKIKDLQDQNVQVESLFNEARNNPFAETE